MTAMRVLLAAAACAALLAACRRDAEPPPPAEPQDPRVAADPFPDADLEASLNALGADPPRPGDPPLFVGRWAAEPAMCATAAWRFTAAGMATPAGSVCAFDEVREAPGGYDLAARCTAEGPERADTLRLRFVESADGMIFDSETVAGAGLVRCPEAD